MATFTIHYQSPASDPHKVPRPHHVTAGDEGAQVRGGEIGLTGLFLGLARDTSPRFDAARWVNADAVAERVAAGETFAGWFACFAGFGEPFTNTAKVARVEVTTEEPARLSLTPPAVRWSVQPNDGTSTPLRLHADMGSTGMGIPVTEADLDALFAVLADRVMTAQPGTERVLEFARQAARYHIGDETWADLLIEYLAVHPDDRAARLEQDGIE